MLGRELGRGGQPTPLLHVAAGFAHGQARAIPPRETLAGKDARTLARELLAMTPEEFSRVFRNSPMKWAKLRGLKRNAAVVLGNTGTAEGVDVLECAFGESKPLVREHAR